MSIDELLAVSAASGPPPEGGQSPQAPAPLAGGPRPGVGPAGSGVDGGDALELYRQWSRVQRSQMMDMWSSFDAKRREADTLKHLTAQAEMQ
eukprot:8773714-Pyramimonas_sp.AAC.1